MSTQLDTDHKTRPIVYADQKQHQIVVMFAGRYGAYSIEDFELRDDGGNQIPIQPVMRNDVSFINIKHINAGVYFLSLYKGDSNPIKLVTF